MPRGRRNRISSAIAGGSANGLCRSEASWTKLCCVSGFHWSLDSSNCNSQFGQSNRFALCCCCRSGVLIQLTYIGIINFRTRRHTFRNGIAITSIISLASRETSQKGQEGAQSNSQKVNSFEKLDDFSHQPALQSTGIAASLPKVYADSITLCVVVSMDERRNRDEKRSRDEKTNRRLLIYQSFERRRHFRNADTTVNTISWYTWYLRPRLGIFDLAFGSCIRYLRTMVDQ